MIWVFEGSFSISKLMPIVIKKKKKLMPYGPFQNKNKIYILLKKLKQISDIKKKSAFQKMQMTYALNYVLYDIGSWHMGTIIKSFVLWDLSFFFFGW